MTNKILLLAASFAAALTSSAFASSPNSNDATTSAPQPRPVAASVVRPSGLPMGFVGAVVNVEFALDQNGQPQNLKVLDVNDAVLKRQLVAAVRQWRFEPGVNAAMASSKRFILPIYLAPGA